MKHGSLIPRWILRVLILLTYFLHVYWLYSSCSLLNCTWASHWFSCLLGIQRSVLTSESYHICKQNNINLSWNFWFLLIATGSLYCCVSFICKMCCYLFVDIFKVYWICFQWPRLRCPVIVWLWWVSLRNSVFDFCLADAQCQSWLSCWLPWLLFVVFLSSLRQILN